MINYFKRIFKRNSTPVSELMQLNELLLKSGRRCAYDLRHVYESLEFYDPELALIFNKRYEIWEKIFNPADIGKEYKDSLNQKINILELEIFRLRKLCEEHKIDYQDPNGVPF